MSKLNDFANSGVAFLSDEVFNFVYWYSYAMIFAVGLVFALIPPFTLIGVAILLAPVVAYGLAWAVVGVAVLADLIDKKLSGFSELKDSNDEDAVIISEPVSVPQASSSQPNLEAALNAQAYSNPLEAVVTVIDEDTENSLQL